MTMCDNCYDPESEIDRNNPRITRAELDDLRSIADSYGIPGDDAPHGVYARATIHVAKECDRLAGIDIERDRARTYFQAYADAAAAGRACAADG